MSQPGYSLRDEQKSQIMRMKANGEPRWRIAEKLGIPLGAVKDVIRLHSPRREVEGHHHAPSHVLSESELSRRRLEIQEGWSPSERANRRAAGATILRRFFDAS